MKEYIYKPPISLPPGSEVIAYLRDSGGPNQEDSIGQQERVIVEYCRQYGLILTRIYADTGSGRKTKKRDQFLEMIHTIETTPAHLLPRGLLLWAYSRFSRDIVQFNRYLYSLLDFGVVIHSLTEEIPDGIAGQILLSLKAYKNAEYSIELGKQIKRGIADRVMAGYSNGGTAPRGYRVVRELHDSKRKGQQRIGIIWEPDPDLAQLVRLAWELRAQGKGYAEIIKATQGKLYTSKNSWTSHFKNKSYLGIGKAGDLEKPDHHIALITQELWDAVKTVEEASPRYGKKGKLLHHRRLKYPSLLSGLSFCIYCGAAMVLHAEKDYRSYACGKRERQRGYKDCTEARRVNAKKADAGVLDAVLTRILSPAFVEDLLNDIQNKMADTSKIDREMEDTYKLLDITKRSISRLMKLAEGTGDLDEISIRLKELKLEEYELTSRIKSLKAERAIEMPPINPAAIAKIFAIWRAQIEQAIQSKDILKAKKRLSEFVKKIELGYNTAIIHYAYPLSIPAEKDSLVRAHKNEPDWLVSFSKSKSQLFCFIIHDYDHSHQRSLAFGTYIFRANA